MSSNVYKFVSAGRRHHKISSDVSMCYMSRIQGM